MQVVLLIIQGRVTILLIIWERVTGLIKYIRTTRDHVINYIGTTYNWSYC